MREFETGAIRDTDENKLDFDGFLSPLVLHRYAEYLNKHRKQADGKFRDSDNWQKGIPLAVYMKSAFRHFFYWWAYHRKADIVLKEDIEESLCGLLFNAMGYLHEYLKDNAAKIDEPEPKFKAGDSVKIVMRQYTGECTKQPVELCGGMGVYVERNDGGHMVLLENTERWFYDDEIFPVEDN